MKAIKTAKKGKRPSGKKAAAVGTKESAGPAEAFKGSGAGARTVKKRKTARISPAAGDETSGKDKNRKTRTARVKPEEAAPSEKAAARKKTPAKKSVSPKKTVRKVSQAGKAPKAGHAKRTAEELTKVIPGHPKSGTRKAETARQNLQTKKSSPAERSAIEKILPAELPREYGENQFFLIPVEPRVVYANWEITKSSMRGEQGGLEVRFFDMTRGKTGGTNSRAFLDISIPERVGDAFFHVGVHGREVIAEIGHRGADGSFKALLTSRKVLIPSAMESDEFGAAAKLPETGGYGSKPPEK
jgi:hypothetical protein